MSARKVYHVSPASEAGWKVQGEGESSPSSTHGTKDEAIAEAKTLAKSHELGQVIVHKKDGKFQTEYTYGEDPDPPKG